MNMKEYSEEDYLMLSGIQHFTFCKRQWALIHIENQWSENIRTIEGNILHEKAHDKNILEKRGDVIISRGMPVVSRFLGISGQCDVVEFHKDKNGVNIFGREGLYKVYPVEYKKGKPKADDIDIMQLTAQVMCLEEMLCCEIEKGYLFYGETRHRETIEINHQYKNKVIELFEEMHNLYDKKHTPNVKRTKACNACSLKDLCLPVLLKKKSVKEYISQAIKEEGFY
jgi:CRISPR-associated exonuclease Cas4